MEWVLLIEMIIKAIQECREARTDPDILAGLNNPGPLEYFAAKRIIRREWRLRGKKLRKKARQAIVELQSLNPAEVEMLMSGDIEALTEASSC